MAAKGKKLVRLPNGQKVPWDQPFVGAAAIAEAMDRETKKFEKWLRKRNKRDPAAPNYIKPLVPKVGGKYVLPAWRLVEIYEGHINFPYSKDDPRHNDYDWRMLKPHGRRGRFDRR